MLKLIDLFAALSHGEFSNLAIANEGDGSILPKFQPKIVLYANDGLLQLFSKFVVKESELLLNLHDYITHYHLVPRFAVNYTPQDESENEPIRYISDTPGERYEGDLLKILSIFDSQGNKLYLNDMEQPSSFFTPKANILQAPDPVSDVVIAVRYQARHEKLTGDPEQAILIPDVLEDPLRAFIAYRVFRDMNTKDSFNAAAFHLNYFKELCASVTDTDLINSSTSTTNTRFARNGWI
jgi:hypothetical protein